MYLRFLRTLIAVYAKRMAGMRGPYAPRLDVLAAISLLQCMNVYVILRYIVLLDSQHCAACDTGARAMFAGLAWVIIMVLNWIAVANNPPPASPAPADYRKTLRWFYGYLLVSIILLL